MQVPILPPNIWGQTYSCHWYLYSHLKYEVAYVAKAWLVGSTHFTTKLLAAICTWNLVGYIYLFSYTKSKAGCMMATSTYYLNPNMKLQLYLEPKQLEVPIFSPQILALMYIWDLASCMYIFSHPKYEARCVPMTDTLLDGRKYLFSHPKYQPG